MSVSEQRAINLRAAHAIRMERARLRREVRANPTILVELMHDPPDCLLSMRLWELLTWPRSQGGASTLGWSIERIAGQAVGRHINLGRMVGGAPLEWRVWLAEESTKRLHHQSPNKGSVAA